MDDQSLVRNIAKELIAILPQNWTKVILFCDSSETSYEIFYYCYINNEIRPIQCYNLSEKYQISKEDIDKCFERLYLMLRPYQEHLLKVAKPVWTNMTMILNATGKFEVNYDYTDLIDVAYEYKMAWKQKYLV